MTDCSGRLPCQYRMRCGLSRPCSGRERVGRPRFNHQDAHEVHRQIVSMEREIERARAWGHLKPSTMSTASLQTLPSVHVPPLQRVVYPWSYLLVAVGGLILGRVSRLDAFSASPVRTSATRRCPWQDNRHTGGASIPVLSY